jgi:hypothetical protein
MNQEYINPHKKQKKWKKGKALFPAKSEVALRRQEQEQEALKLHIKREEERLAALRRKGANRSFTNK